MSTTTQGAGLGYLLGEVHGTAIGIAIEIKIEIEVETGSKIAMRLSPTSNVSMRSDGESLAGSHQVHFD